MNSYRDKNHVRKDLCWSFEVGYLSFGHGVLNLISRELLFMSHSWFVRHEHGWSSEHVTEWIVNQIENGCRIEIRISVKGKDNAINMATFLESLQKEHDSPNNLRREERLSGSGSEQRSQETVRHIHFVDDFLHGLTNIGDIRFLGSRWIQVSTYKKQNWLRGLK